MHFTVIFSQLKNVTIFHEYFNLFVLYLTQRLPYNIFNKNIRLVSNKKCLNLDFHTVNNYTLADNFSPTTIQIPKKMIIFIGLSRQQHTHDIEERKKTESVNPNYIDCSVTPQFSHTLTMHVILGTL